MPVEQDGSRHDQELTSWKEIAAFLNVTARTAQKWESERALPVRRLPGPRGRVSASLADLEAWKQAANRVAPPPAARRRRLFLSAGAAVFVLAVLLVAATIHPAEPALFRIEQDCLVVSDGSGRPLWRKHFDHLNPATYEDPANKKVWVGDLDGDGHAEVLFAPTATGFNGPLYCFGRDGEVRWSFSPGRTVRTAAAAFAPPFSINAIEVVRAGTGRQVLVVAAHHLYHPTQVALLSPAGILQREYWHAGLLHSPVLADVDGDGVEDLLLSGIHNSSGSATLVALDLRRLGGASVETDAAYQILGFSPAAELGRLELPRTCINRFEPYPAVESVRLAGGELILSVAQRLSPLHDAEVLYEFGTDMVLHDAVLADQFTALHASMRRRGELDHDLSAAEVAALRSVTYLRRPMRASRAAR